MTKALTKPDAALTPMQRFFRNADLSALEGALKASDNQRFQTFLQMMHSKKYCKMALDKLAMKCHLTLKDWTMLYRDERLHEGMIRMSNHLPDVMEDVAIDSKSRNETCVVCSGKGKITVVVQAESQVEGETVKGPVEQETMCSECYGKGVIRISGDADARKLLFETMKLTNQRGPLVALQQNFGAVEPLDQTISEIDRIIDTRKTA